MVPDFQTLMGPIIDFHVKRQTVSKDELIAYLAQLCNLTEADLDERLPSGHQKRFSNRVGWALTHLKKAGVLEQVSRAVTRVTERGTALRADVTSKVSMKVLERFPEYVAFRHSVAGGELDIAGQQAEQLAQSPKEVLEVSYQSLRAEVESDLLERLLKLSPSRFEQIVLDLMLEMGYGGLVDQAATWTGRSGDGGIDGTIKEDKLGLDMIYIQAKRYALDASIGREAVQAFVGSLEGHRANKGVFITTARYSQDARIYVNHIGKKIVLIDGNMLTQLMYDFGLGVIPEQTYQVKRLSEDFFTEE